MATSTIKKPVTNDISTSNFVGYILGTSGTQNIGTFTMNNSLKLIEVRIHNILTGTTLNAGTSYNIGSITWIKPLGPLKIAANRNDSGNASATISVETDGSWRLEPLMTIPQGVALRAHVMFFYQ